MQLDSGNENLSFFVYFICDSYSCAIGFREALIKSGSFSCLVVYSYLNYQYFIVKYVIILASFLVQNNLHELWSLLNFLLPEIFSSAETFDEWFQISGENDQQEVVQQLHKAS